MLYIADFSLRMASFFIYVQHRLLGLLACQLVFEVMAVALAVHVTFQDVDVRRWLQVRRWSLRLALGAVLFVLLGCCQVIHLKRAWARQLRAAEVVRSLDDKDFLWTGPALGAERTLPVALITGVPLALISSFAYLTLDCSYLGARAQEDPMRRFCEKNTEFETMLLTGATIVALCVVSLGVVDIDIAVSAYVARRYHFDPWRRGTRAGRLQWLYPAVHASFRTVEVILRVMLLVESVVLARFLTGPLGAVLASSFVGFDFILGVAILRSCSPRTERLIIHTFVGVGLLLADVARFVDRPGFCQPAKRISRAMDCWRLLQFVTISGVVALELRLKGCSATRAYEGLRWQQGLLLVAAAAYGALRCSPMIRRAGDDLHTAVLRGRIDRVQKLLDAGRGGEALDVDGRTKDALRATPAMLAAGRGQVEALQLLVGAGARMYLRDGQEETCLHHAVRGGHVDALEFLVMQTGSQDLQKCGPSLRELAQRQRRQLPRDNYARLLALLEPCHRRRSQLSHADRNMRCVQAQLARGRHLCKLFPEAVVDSVPPLHELHSVSALIFAHASGPLARVLLPPAAAAGWLESLRRVRTLGRGALGEVIEVEVINERQWRRSSLSNSQISVASSRQKCSDGPGAMCPSPSGAGSPRTTRFAMKLQAKAQAQADWQACAEVVALRRAAHPFIVRLEEAFQTPQFYALLLEFCPRGDLNRVLCQTEDEHGKRVGLPLELCARYAGQVMLALLHLHEALGIVYRDVKPQNILISVEDEAKLADFGTALYVGVAEQVEMPFAGTRGFLAPELVLGACESDGESAGQGEGADCIDPFKTDAYSFGVTLEVMLMGESSAELHEDEDGGMWMLPRVQPEEEGLRLLREASEAGRIAPEAAAFLAELLPQSPRQRRRLADPVVRRHAFFARTLGCEDISQVLLPVRSP